MNYEITMNLFKLKNYNILCKNITYLHWLISLQKTSSRFFTFCKNLITSLIDFQN